MSGRMFTLFALALATTVADTAPSFAQQARLVAAQSAQAGTTTRSESDGIKVNEDGTLNIDIRNVSIPDALDRISARTGVAILYDRRAPGIARSISVQMSNATPMSAVQAILKGTNMNAVRTQSGQVVISTVSAERGSRKSSGVIAGKITDAKTGKGISGATISLGNNTGGVTTGEDGAYRIIGVSAGTHTISVRLVGYTRQSRVVTVGEGVTATADFKLEPSANVLDQVVVTGTVVSTELKAVPNAITVITAKQLEERGVTRIDQLFRGEIPGMFSLNRGSNALLDEVTMFSRGATALTNTSPGTDGVTGALTNPIKTYIDGVEMADSKYLSQIDPKSIERIEILTGPQASTIYGANAINGVMQIFTKRGSTSKPQLTLSLSSGVSQNNFSSNLAPSHVADASASGIEGRWSYNVGGGWNYAGSWTPAKQTQRLSANGGGRIDLGKLNADVSARRGLTKNIQNGNQNEGQRTTVLRGTGLYEPNVLTSLPSFRTNTLLGQTIGLSLSIRPFSWWTHDIGFGSDALTNELIVNAPGLTSLSDTLLSITHSVTSRVSERYSTTMQLAPSSFAHLNLTMGGDHWRNNGSTWFVSSLALTGSSLSNPFVSRTHPDKNSGAFAQGQLGLWDALFFTYGVRADWNPSFGDKVKVKPGRYGVSYTRDIETPVGPVSAKLRGSYGSSIRPPSSTQKLSVSETSTSRIALFGPYNTILANPDLLPEHQQGGEGGVELYFGSRASLVVTRYNQTVNNLISQVGSITASGGPGLDSVRALQPGDASGFCSSSFRDAEGYCYRYQQQFLNVGSIRNQGWELTSSLNIGPLTTRGTYSWTKSRVLGVTPKYKAFLTSSAFAPGRPFNYVPEHTWALGATYAHSASSLSLSVNGVGMRYISQNALTYASGSINRSVYDRPLMALPSNYRSMSSGYATADLNATHRFSSRIDATLQINNLTNYYENDFSIAYATIGRQSRLGFRWRIN